MMGRSINTGLMIATIAIALGGCSPGSSGSSKVDSSVETTGSCRTTGNGHTGCCSSHGGIGGQCSGGAICYTPSGRLVCTDGTISPTCTQSLNSDAPEERRESGILSTEENGAFAVTCT